MSDAGSSTLKHVQPWASYAPALCLGFPPIKGDAGPRVPESRPQGSVHVPRQRPPPGSMGPWSRVTSPPPRPGWLQEALSTGMGTGSGHTRDIAGTV